MENLKHIHEAWQRAKERAARLCMKAGREDVAQKLNDCRMFRGDETLEELCDLLFTAQGTEFISHFGFPTASVFRQFKKYDTQQFGVYIDAGEITLNDAQRVLLVGKTVAHLNYCQTQANQVCVLHGATALIDACGFAVVNVELDRNSKSRTIIHDHAFVR